MIESLITAARDDERILAVMLYGSRARGDASPESDTDICLVMRTDTVDRERSAALQLDYGSFHELDVRVYQRLPIYIRQRVLQDGKVLYVRDEDELYEVAFRTIREFGDFRPFYREYLEAVAND